MMNTLINYIYTIIDGINNGIILLIGIGMVYYKIKKDKRWNK